MKRIYLPVILVIICTFFVQCNGNSSEQKKYKSVPKEWTKFLNTFGTCTRLEKFINWYRENRHKSMSKNHFEDVFLLNVLHGLSNCYVNDCNPYDTILNVPDGEVKTISYTKEDIERFDKTLQASLGITRKKMNRKDFWDEILDAHKKYGIKDLYPDLERSIYELHDSLGLSWEDTIYVRISFLENMEHNIKEMIFKGDSIKKIKSERK